MDKKVLVQCFDRRRNEIVIPDTVEVIRPYAFDGVPVTKLDLGLGVLSIGEFAFASSEIKTIRIPDQLVELDENAFNYSKCNSVRVRKKIKISILMEFVSLLFILMVKRACLNVLRKMQRSISFRRIRYILRLKHFVIASK